MSVLRHESGCIHRLLVARACVCACVCWPVSVSVMMACLGYDGPITRHMRARVRVAMRGRAALSAADVSGAGGRRPGWGGSEKLSFFKHELRAKSWKRSPETPHSPRQFTRKHISQPKTSTNDVRVKKQDN